MPFNTALLDSAIAACTELGGAIVATDISLVIDGAQEARINDAKTSLPAMMQAFIGPAEQVASPTVLYKNVLAMTVPQYCAKIRALAELGCLSGFDLSQAAGVLQSVKPFYEAL